MVLQELRRLFQNVTGRIDLSPLMINQYINNGQRFLDDQIDHDYQRARLIKTITSGTYLYTFTRDIKVLENVRLIYSAGVTVAELKYLALDDMHALFPGVMTATNGTPEWYSKAMVRRAITTEDSPTSLTGKVDIIETGNTSNYNGVVFNCPVNQACVLDIEGKFYSEDVYDQMQDSWWLARYPFTLLEAAIYRYNVTLRNREGAKENLENIAMVLDGIDKNTAEQECAHITRMEG